MTVITRSCFCMANRSVSPTLLPEHKVGWVPSGLSWSLGACVRVAAFTGQVFTPGSHSSWNCQEVSWFWMHLILANLANLLHRCHPCPGRGVESAPWTFSSIPSGYGHWQVCHRWTKVMHVSHLFPWHCSSHSVSTPGSGRQNYTGRNWSLSRSVMLYRAACFRLICTLAISAYWLSLTHVDTVGVHWQSSLSTLYWHQLGYSSHDEMSTLPHRPYDIFSSK